MRCGSSAGRAPSRGRRRFARLPGSPPFTGGCCAITLRPRCATSINGAGGATKSANASTPGRWAASRPGKMGGNRRRQPQSSGDISYRKEPPPKGKGQHLSCLRSIFVAVPIHSSIEVLLIYNASHSLAGLRAGYIKRQTAQVRKTTDLKRSMSLHAAWFVPSCPSRMVACHGCFSHLQNVAGAFMSSAERRIPCPNRTCHKDLPLP